jgi:hypothetical protein
MIIEPRTSKPAVPVLSAEPELTIMALNATAGNGPTITIELRLGCSVVNWAIRGLTLK